MTAKLAGNNKESFDRIFGGSKITIEEELRLKEVCKQIRKLSFQDISKRGLCRAHDILTGGVVLPAKAISDQSRYMWLELNRISRNPPRVSSYVRKLEKAYAALRVK